MESLFEIVAIGASVLFVVLGVLSSIGRGSVHDQMIGGGDLSMDHGPSPEDRDGEDGEAQRDEEIRQMLRARSERLVRQGEQPLDIEAELEKLSGSAGDLQDSADASYDPAAIEEARQLAIARNTRRRREGLEELDVQAEVTRTLRGLNSSNRS